MDDENKSKDEQFVFEKYIFLLLKLFEDKHPQEVKNLKDQIESGDVEQSSITLLEKFLSTGQHFKLLWTMKYILYRDKKILIRWMNQRIDNNPNQKGINAANSQKNLLSYFLKSEDFSIKELKLMLHEQETKDIIINGNEKKSTRILKRNLETVGKKLSSKANTKDKSRNIPGDAEIQSTMYRLNIFKENDSSEKTFLNGSDFDHLKGQLERFIKTGEYDKPKTKLNPCLDYNIIRFLFKQINSDLFKKSEKRIDRETRDFIGFMMDFFHFPSNWHRERYISKHYTDPIDLLNKYKKYNQFLKG